MSTYLEENKLADSVAESTARLRSNTLLAYADNQSQSRQSQNDTHNTSINSPAVVQG